jgi:hypothetical protein
MMEIQLFDIASEKTSDPKQLADLEELRRCALAVAEVEREQTNTKTNNQPGPPTPGAPAENEQTRGRVYVIQSRFCRRADSASEAIESLVGFEREELDFLHLLSDLAGYAERSRLQPLIRSKEELVIGMELFVDTWK